MTPAERRQLLLGGPIVSTILLLSAPNVLNVLAQSLVLTADGYFAGQLGTAELAALALVFPAQITLSMMSAGAMGGGISSSVARALGAGDRAGADAAAIHALVIALVMAVLFAIVFAGFGRVLYGLQGGSGGALDGAVAFANVLFLGCAAHWVGNSLASILRGTGDMRTPGLALLTTAILQVPLCGALTLGWAGLPKLGVMGPPAAAVISFTAAAVWMAWPLLSGTASVRLRWPTHGLRWAPFRDILKVGGVACIVVVLVNAAVMVVTGLIGRAGDGALAGYGIGGRLEYMLSPISFGVGATLTALVGTNIGAGLRPRARRVAWTGALMVGAFTGLIGIVVAIWPDLWLGLFTTDSAALAQGRLYLSTVGPTFSFFGVSMALFFAAQGTGAMFHPVLANLVRIAIAAGGGLLSLDVLGWGAPGLYGFVALGIMGQFAILAYSTTTRVWVGATPRS